MIYLHKSIAYGLLIFGAVGFNLVQPKLAFGHNSEHQPALEKTAAKATDQTPPDYTSSLKSYSIPDVTLIDADEKPIRLRELLAAKDPVIVNFIFTTCRAICPVTTKVLSDVPALLGSDSKQLRMISISIDPENDTPLQMKAYARSFHAGERWKFLTGRVDDIKAVLLAFESYRGDKMNHEPLTLIRLSPEKSWLRIEGFASSSQLVQEYRKSNLQ